MLTYHVEVTLFTLLSKGLLSSGHLLPLLGLGGQAAAAGGHHLLLALVEAAHLLVHHLPPLLTVHLLSALLLQTFVFLLNDVLVTEG